MEGDHMEERLFTLSILDHDEGVEASCTVAEPEDGSSGLTALSVTTTRVGGRITTEQAAGLLARLGLPLASQEAPPRREPRRVEGEAAAELTPGRQTVSRPPWAELRRVGPRQHWKPAALATHYGVPVQTIYGWLHAGRRAGELPPADGRRALAASAS